MRIAVIGSGIAGLGAAHLLSQAHEVRLLEADDRLGGHTSTVAHPRGDGSVVALDTGFIVHNLPNYPNLVRLFRELGVATQESDMSFSVTCRRCGIEYSGAHLERQPRVLASPRHLALLAEIARFIRRAPRTLRDDEAVTLGDYARAEGYSDGFVRHFLIPITASIWSTAPDRALDMPAAFAIRFLDNHGILRFRRFTWRTVTGGSRRYVDAIAARLGGAVRLGSPVTAVRRGPDDAAIRVADGDWERYDQVVIATHPDQALAMLTDASDEERRILGAFTYAPSSSVLHTDETLLPRRSARASWNYVTDDCRAPAPHPAITYHLNTLQRLAEPDDYCVSLNMDDRIAPARVIRRFTYAHPQYSAESVAAQRALPSLSGARRTWYCGAYHGHGFHEDGFTSAVAVAHGLGVDW